MCLALELYRKIVPDSIFTMDQFILLVTALAAGDELMVARCSNCHATLLLDRMGLQRRLCPWCKRKPVFRSRSRANADGLVGAVTGKF
jgi:hypothetical protein